MESQANQSIKAICIMISQSDDEGQLTILIKKPKDALSLSALLSRHLILLTYSYGLQVVYRIRHIHQHNINYSHNQVTRKTITTGPNN